MDRRIVHAAQLGALVIALLLVPVAFAATGGGKGGGTSGCTQAAPSVAVDNTWAWGAWGSWALPGQERMYSIHVINNDVGCSSSSFVVNLSAPDGFSVSIPTNSITLNSSSSGYLSAYVTSPTTTADGDYPLTVTVRRAGTATPAASTITYYKVYSSDSVSPTLFWPNPGDGTTISGRSYNVTVSSNDDHQVKKIDVYIDDAYTSTKPCDGVAYTCQLYYKWAIRRVQGQHTATFKSYDWMGNVGVLSVTFNVN